jgi:hypothetical protein
MRGWTRLFVALTAAVVGTASDQQVFQQRTGHGLGQVQRASDTTNSTGNLIFSSVNSLLQQWPNTRYINGMMTFRYSPLKRVDVR